MKLTIFNSGNIPSVITLDTSKDSITISNNEYEFIIPSTEYKKLEEAIGLLLTKKESLEFLLAKHHCKIQRISNSNHAIVLTVLCSLEKQHIELFEIDHFVLVGNNPRDLQRSVKGYLTNQTDDELINIDKLITEITRNGAFPNLSSILTQ